MNEPILIETKTVFSECRDVLKDIESKFLCCHRDIIPQDFFNYTSWDYQKIILDRTVLHTLNRNYPIRRSYQITFLKKLIEYLESQNEEVHDVIYEELCRLQAHPENDINEKTFKHYCLPKRNVHFTLQESKSFVSNGTTGLCTWQASLVLSNWLLSNPGYVKGKSVLELGSGTGLLGFIVSKCCNANRVFLTDGSPEVIKSISDNLRRNFKEGVMISDDTEKLEILTYEGLREIGVFLLPWEDVQGARVENIIRPEIILAADVVYDHSIFLPLANTLDYVFKTVQNECSMLLASTIRNDKTLKDFYNVLEKKGFILDRRKQCSSDEKELWCDDAIVEIVHISRNKS